VTVQLSSIRVTRETVAAEARELVAGLQKNTRGFNVRFEEFMCAVELKC
jgi:hypothetical protein